MVRSIWVGAVVAILACSTPGWGQGMQPGQTITVREEGKPPAQCVVVKSYTDKDGTRRCQVKVIATGEILTLVEDTIPAAQPSKWLPRTNLFSSKATAPSSATTVQTVQPPLATKPVEKAQPSTTSVVVPTSKSEAAPAPSSAQSNYGVKRVTGVTTPTGSIASPKKETAPTVVASPKASTPVCTVCPETPKRPSSTWSTHSLFGFSRSANKVECNTCTPSQTVKVATPTVPTITSGRPNLPTPSASGSDTVLQSSLRQQQVSSLEPPMETPPVETLDMQTGLRKRLFGTTHRAPVEKVTGSDVVVESSPNSLSTRLGSLFSRNSSRTETMPGVEVGATTLSERIQRNRTEKVVGADRRTLKDLLPGRPTDSKDGVNASEVARSRRLPPGMASVAATGTVYMDPVSGRPFLMPSISVGTGNAFSQSVPAMAMAAPQGPMPALPPGPQIAPYGMAGYYPAGMPLPPSLAGSYVPQVPGPQVALVAVPFQAMPQPGRAVIRDEEPATAALLQTLKSALLPSDREMAVEQLTRVNWKADANVVPALIQAAQSDPAATVRASCIRALGVMKVNSVLALQTIQGLKSDQDARVRLQAEQTLSTLSVP